MDSNTHNDNTTFFNWLFSGLAAFFTMLETSSPDQIYTWIFRVLTLISISLIIVINWEKAMNVLFKNKKQKKKIRE